MSEHEKEVKKGSEDTLDSTTSAEEKKSTNPAGQEPAEKKSEDGEWKPPSKEEWEATLKKANDFDGMLAKKRAEKLAAKENKAGGNSQDVDETSIEEIARKAVLDEMNKVQFNSNLQPAFQEFVKDHPYANSDEALEKIRSNFQPGTVTSVKDIKAALENAAEKTFPVEFRQAKDDKYKKQSFAAEENINAGELGGGGSEPGSANKTEKRKLNSEEEKFADAFGIKDN